MRTNFFKTSKFFLWFTYRTNYLSDGGGITYLVYIETDGLDKVRSFEDIMDMEIVMGKHKHNNMHELEKCNWYNCRIIRSININGVAHIKNISNATWWSEMTCSEAVDVLKHIWVYDMSVYDWLGRVKEKLRVAKELKMPYMYSINGFTWEITDIEI